MRPANDCYDAVIVGAGMAGASLAAELAVDMSVLLVEMEEQPGYHATGRSVAFWQESYGGPGVQPLTRASRPLLEQPEPDFAEAGFLVSRGALHIGRSEDEGQRAAMVEEFGSGVFEPLDGRALAARVPGLRQDWVVGLEEPGTCDIDVAALHTAYLRRFRKRGGALLCRSRFERAHRAGGEWEIALSGATVRAPLLINAAGAWADTVAVASGVRPVGIAPLLRTVVQLRVDPPVADALPLILDLAGDFYFKPVGGGRIWLTPHDEQPSEPGDVAPDAVDIALAIERLQSAVDWKIEAVERKWAGLRSFAPDRLPVYGRDPDQPDFFWFAGQGGFGIQTAPAAARLAAALILGRDDPLLAGLDASRYAPQRFRRESGEGR